MRKMTSFGDSEKIKCFQGTISQLKLDFQPIFAFVKEWTLQFFITLHCLHRTQLIPRKTMLVGPKKLELNSSFRAI